MEFLVEYLGWVIAVLVPLAISLINAVTKHYSGSDGFKRLMLCAIEFLSFLRSSNVPGLLKYPVQDMHPIKAEVIKIMKEAKKNE